MSLVSNQVEKEELLDELKVLLDYFMYSVKRSLHNAQKDLPLAGGQFFLMFMLSEHGHDKVSDMAMRLGLTAGAVTSMTDKLVNEGLIARERSEEDRRVVWLSLTDKGCQVIEEAQKIRFQFFRDRFKNLQDEDLKKAIEVFNKLNFELNQEREK